MPQADWDFVRNEQPAGGRCNFDWTGGSTVHVAQGDLGRDIRYQLSGADHVHRRRREEEVFLRLHQQRETMPAPRLRQVRQSHLPGTEALIGSRYVTLNNSIQDRSYVRQPLGYTLLGMAGLPHSRCNFVRVLVNGIPIGQGLAGVNSPGIYVNAEPIMKRYIERNFHGNMKGNLYELEHHDDFVARGWTSSASKSLSKFDDKADLKLRRRSHRRRRPGGREPDARSRPVHQAPRDGVLS